jgi:hypothetical protein
MTVMVADARSSSDGVPMVVPSGGGGLRRGVSSSRRVLNALLKVLGLAEQKRHQHALDHGQSLSPASIARGILRQNRYLRDSLRPAGSLPAPRGQRPRRVMGQSLACF